MGMGMTGNLAYMGNIKNGYNRSVRKPSVVRLHDDQGTDASTILKHIFKETWLEVVYWARMALVKMRLNLCVPQNTGNLLTT
jgi:hypothetical protein